MAYLAGLAGLAALLLAARAFFSNGALYDPARAPETFVPDCQPPTAIAPEKPVQANVWLGLTVEEVVDIREWLLDPAQGFNLTRGEKAKINDNFVEVIEAIPPPKADALAFYKGGPKPARFARAVLSFGGHAEPTVQNMRVGPLPISKSTKAVPHSEIYHRPVVPHNSRTMTVQDSLFNMFGQLTKDLERVSQSLFGGVMRGLPNDTLTVAGSGPWSFDGSFRRLWIQWKRTGPGSWLNPLPFFQYIDASGTDPSLWKTTKLVYNRQVFSSTADFVQAFDNGTLEIEHIPDIDPAWTTRVRKGDPRDLDDKAGPRAVSFAGHRFRVDTDQRYVSWMGWDFYLGFDRDMGLSLWNINFLNERVIYELAPQEGGDDPRQATTAWLDRYFGMGACVHEMLPGYDCPHGAVFLPATVHSSSGSMTNPRAICIFEQDTGRALSRHRGYAKGETGAIKDYVLVVRSVSTVGKYFDYTFMLDGSLEVRVSASGYLQGGYWYPEHDQHGTRLYMRSMGTLHDHVINFKVDFDLVNERNSLLEKKTQVRDVPHEWLDDDWGPSTRQQFISQRIIKNESEARLRYPQNFQGAYAIVNTDEKNAWGVPRGYQIIPGMSPIHNTVVGSKRLLKNANWAKDNMAVTRRHETEPSSSSAWNQHLPGAPPVDFDLFFDGESIEQEDIVAWVNVGTHHLTQAEVRMPRSLLALEVLNMLQDVPNTRMNTAFVLSPLNFHDSDVSLASANAVLLNQDAHGRWVADENGVKEPRCVPKPPAALDYGHDVAYDLNGKEIRDPASPWLRAEVFPYANHMPEGGVRMA
ncbi:amine oxidase catalytic domain-containing protein [Exidia glandulosa HHB12029]|uniref:Amine oxidase n=1 Tax=Exidia glandulosa HHB12029 TaxID=1314781 RepID=A0A165LHW3_EXIGL|nr:amine oxidase catalytic domain-containing protein [Exidia glandulosa HHB12029]